MLVLTRRSGQKILIGEDIEIVIIAPRNKTVKVGIIAPDTVDIKRDEVLKKDKENVSE